MLCRSGGTNRSFDIEVNTRGDTVYSFSSTKKDKYSRLYKFLKSKKIAVKSAGKMDASKLDLSNDHVDHHAELVEADAESSSNSALSSDDEDFNLDKLDEKDVKEYNSDPSDTGSDSGPGEEKSLGSEAKEKKRVKAEKREQKSAKKNTSAPRKEKGEGKEKKKTKLPGQP